MNERERNYLLEKLTDCSHDLRIEESILKKQTEKVIILRAERKRLIAKLDGLSQLSLLF